MANEEQRQLPSVPEWLLARQIPEFYVDEYNLRISPYTALLTFSLGIPNQPSVPQCLVRMSPAHAKVMSILLKRGVKEHEEKQKYSIEIPAALAASLEISDSDW